MIFIKNDNSVKIQKEIHKELRAYNRKNCKWIYDNEDVIPSRDEKRYNNFIVYDDGKLIGGALGFIEYQWYFLDKLYISEKYRGKGIGKMLIHNVENFARKNSLVGVRMGTWDFQAKEFYEKLGYEVFGEIKDCPPDTIHYDFKKVFSYNL